MSREAVNLLRGAGFTIKHKMGKQKFVSAFRQTTSSARIRRKRSKLITKLIAECMEDQQITKRLERHEDLTRLALTVHHILRHPEYSNVTDGDTLRSIIALLLVDTHHRESVGKVLKENRQKQWPEYRPLCTAKRLKTPQTVVNTIFNNMDKAWNYKQGRYNKNKAGIKFQKAIRDLLSKDWISNYCLLAGYVPVLKNRKLGSIGKVIGETCGCRTLDKFAVRKSTLKKIYREANNYKYHTMKSSLKKAGMTLRSCAKNPRPGVWTRVFTATSAQVARAQVSATASASNILTVASGTELNEKSFTTRNIKELSSPFLITKDVQTVAIKAFMMTPHLPLKLLPARILTYMELTTVLNHPNIVPFIESFASTSDIFVVMPYAANRSLHHIINNHGRLMQKTAQVWTFHIAMAVQYLHTAGIIHRNIKCSNILITQNYNALLSGFGSAKIKWLDGLHLQEPRSSNYHAGYQPYRAPEVLRRRPYSLTPIDVWSLGVVLFRMLNNRFPYCHHNVEVMSQQQRSGKFMENWQSSPASEQCKKLLKRMLQPNPAKRIKIDGVVNHCWFAELPTPKSHKKSMRKAAWLFLPQEQNDDEGTEEQTVTTKPGGHKDATTTLEELHNLLGKITKPSENRKFQPLEAHEAYRECYAENKLRHGALVKNIDDALRLKIPKIKRPPPPLLYEPYISDQETTEIQEQTEAGIHELKKRPEQAQKLLQTPEVDWREKMTLKTVVKNVKEKFDQVQMKEDELSKKTGLFAPKRESSNQRSALPTKPTKSAVRNPIGSSFWPTSKESVIQGSAYPARSPALSFMSSTVKLTDGGHPKSGFLRDSSSPSRTNLPKNDKRRPTTLDGADDEIDKDEYSSDEDDTKHQVENEQQTEDEVAIENEEL